MLLLPALLTGPTFDSTAKTFTVTCTPTTVGGTFPKDVVGFVGVKLQVTAKDSCGNTLEAVDATAAVQLGPYLDISVKTSPEICPDATSATAVFTYSTKHSSEIPTFEVLTPSGCASTVDSSKQQLQLSVEHSLSLHMCLCNALSSPSTNTIVVTAMHLLQVVLYTVGRSK